MSDLTSKRFGTANRDVKNAMWLGIKCRCPNCGEGKMFSSWLKVTPTCASCGEELHHEKAQDLPPYLTIMIVGHIVVGLVLSIESRFDLSMMTHLLLWVPIGTIMTLGIMQPVKGAVVGLQWALRMFGFGDGYDEE